MADIDTSLQELGEAIKATIPRAVTAVKLSFGELTITVKAEAILDVLTHLRDAPNCLFASFVDICGVDYPQRERRFDVVYHLLSPKYNRRIRIKAEVDERTPIASAVGVYPAADWFEREAYDLYGILFTGHPDLRRILTDYGFEGHPLRKDFPLTGFVEVRWDDGEKRVMYEPVRLPQEFRSFDFLSPWEGPAYEVDHSLPGDEKASKV